MYYNRRVHTKELAERVACVTAEDLKKASQKVYKNTQVYCMRHRICMSACGVRSLSSCINDIFEAILNLVIVYFSKCIHVKSIIGLIVLSNNLE